VSSAAIALALPVRALDRVRLAWLRALGPLAKPLVRSRDLRVAVFGTLSLTLALVLTSTVPLVVLAVVPLLLGVPHVGSDLRYLVFRPGLHRRFALVAGSIALFAAHSYTVDARFGIGVTLLAIVLARGAHHGRRLLALAIAATWMGLACSDLMLTSLAFAHFHNFVAIAFLWAWRPKGAGRLQLVPIVVFAIYALVIALGGVDAVVARANGLAGVVGRTGLDWNLALYAPGVAAPWGPRLVLLFAFAQSAHYSVWLRLLPEDDRDRETPPTWAATLRSLRADVGMPMAVLLFAATIALALWATIDLYEARMGYLRMVLFHGYLEMAVLALMFVEARPLRAANAVT
jgi:hypothetical protein